MDKLFNNIFQQTTMGIGIFLLCILFSFIIGVIYLIAYKIKNETSRTMEVAILILPTIISVVIIMVNGNLGVGVAIAGAFSLVRFRSVQGNAKDICLIFMVMCSGLIIGVGYIGYAMVFSIVMGTLVVLSNMLILNNKKLQYKKCLKITLPDDLDYENIFDEILNKYTNYHKIQSIKTTNLGSLIKIKYDIILKEDTYEKDFIDELRVKNGNLEIAICNTEINNEL